MKQVVAWLDRDGTIVDDPGYLSDPAKLVLLPGAAEAIARLNRAGIRVVLVTNQSGIGRGLMTAADVAAVHRELERRLAADGAHLDGIEICPHAPPHLLPATETACDCRKPQPGLIERARAREGIYGALEFVVGDKVADLGLARNTGCRSALVRSGEGTSTETELIATDRLADFADHVVDDLGMAASLILREAEREGDA